MKAEAGETANNTTTLTSKTKDQIDDESEEEM